MRSPGYYNDYPSYAVSKYWCWFKDMGYPSLDIHDEGEGIWWLIQYHNSPIIPSLTKWQAVLGPMKHVEKSYGFCAKYISELDITKKAFWAREEEKTRQIFEEGERTERREEEFAERATNAVMRNPDLVQRIAKKGVKEADLRYLGMHVPKSEIVKPLKGVPIDVPNTSVKVNENVSTPVSGSLPGKTS